MATIDLHRRRELLGITRDLIIKCDGEPIAALRPGRSASVHVPAGPHQLVASMDWFNSPALALDLAADDHIVLQAKLFRKAFFRIYRAIRRGQDPHQVGTQDGIVLAPPKEDR